ncbi:MAG: tetratricopeptide repeat protein [Pseudomonadota bacterium]|nr:tetratricopeptide repeat protein [Pseudomonadota bacterium]
MELREEIGNRRGLATSLRNLANVQSLTGNFDQAEAHLRQARGIHEELGDREGLAAVENEIGLLAEERGDFPGALESFRRALQSWRQAGDAHGSAEALNNIGFAHYQLGAYDDAQAYWQQAAAAYEQLGSQTGQIRTSQNLGLLAGTRGRWKEARQLLDVSLQNAEQQQMPEEAAVSRRNLAELELLQGNVSAALEQARRAEAMFRQRDDRRGTVDAVILRVQALLLAGADAQARSALEELRPGLREAAVEQQALARMLDAEIARRGGDMQRASKSLEDAHGLAAKSGVRQLQLQIALTRAQAQPADSLAALGQDTLDLGHAGLRLDWLALAMEQALRKGDAPAAAAAYREATGLLRPGPFRGEAALHRLGVLALRGQDDEAAAQRAERAAQAAHEALRRGVPEELRQEFDRLAVSPGELDPPDPGP